MDTTSYVLGLISGIAITVVVIWLLLKFEIKVLEDER